MNSHFKIPYKDIVMIYFVMAKDLHIVPSEIDHLEFWFVLYLLQQYLDWVEERNEQTKVENEKYNAQVEQMQRNMPNMQQMQQMQAPSMPQMPQMPSMPSFPKM